ncbi:L-seryl-tRNA(Sec) selenium transferase [candidate division KSB1 bacterium]|nr:L-seryl-tRNA(Sec) selenium transferase [candidate division KSB1 bacterium]
MSEQDPRRRLPAVETLRGHHALTPYRDRIASEFLTLVIREAVEAARGKLDAGSREAVEQALIADITSRLDALLRPSLRYVLNATGVILHTGLGRAPLSDDAAEAAHSAAKCCNLELDLVKGDRGDRQLHVERLLCVLTGAEAALVVNNNAAALYLTLNTLAHRREVIVSRGQLIEIGGSFRLPDIMSRAGVVLREVGTTNRTRAADFSAAITPKTALLLRAYPSNFRIDGFSESVGVAELAALARERSLPVIDDLGGGLLWDWTATGLPYEPNVRESLTSGADLVLVSGDKVLGGPQAGIILGRRDLVTKLKQAPLARVVRADKLAIAALAETLRAYLDPRGPIATLPVWQMLTVDIASLRRRAAAVIVALRPLVEWKVLEVVESKSETGSGTLPAVSIPSIAVRCLPESMTASKFARALRERDMPVVGTLQRDAVWLDLRTIPPSDDVLLLESVRIALKRECFRD